MSNYTTIARPYAKAIFEIALQQKAISAWANLLQFASAVVNDARVQALLDNPQSSAKQRYDFLVKTCAKVMMKEGENLLKLLAEKNRLTVIPEINALFEAYRAEQEKQVKAEVVSAFPLSQEEQQKIIKTLTQRLQREVILECKTDSALIGGMVIRAGDLVMDGSVRGKLERLKSELMN